MSYFKTKEAEQRYKEAKKRSGMTLQKQYVEIYEQSPSYCKHCNTKIPYEKRNNIFCNRTCSTSFNNKGVRRHGSPQDNDNCLFCSKELNSHREQKYCSRHHQHEYIYQEYIKRWLNGEETGITGKTGTSNHIRRYLVGKYGNMCQECGWDKINPYTNKIPIQLEHIDGNWKNNKEENLTLLCPSCHSLTATFGGANKGNGREKRYK